MAISWRQGSWLFFWVIHLGTWLFCFWSFRSYPLNVTFCNFHAQLFSDFLKVESNKPSIPLWAPLFLMSFKKTRSKAAHGQLRAWLLVCCLLCWCLAGFSPGETEWFKNCDLTSPKKPKAGSTSSRRPKESGYWPVLKDVRNPQERCVSCRKNAPVYCKSHNIHPQKERSSMIRTSTS